MHGAGKSDGVIVPKKGANRAEARERLEGRAEAKGWCTSAHAFARSRPPSCRPKSLRRRIARRARALTKRCPGPPRAASGDPRARGVL
jgi:hypothetical protein